MDSETRQLKCGHARPHSAMSRSKHNAEIRRIYRKIGVQVATSVPCHARGQSVGTALKSIFNSKRSLAFHTGLTPSPSPRHASGLHVSAQVRWTSGHWSPGPPDSFHPESAAPEGSPRGSCPATPVLAPAAATDANGDWPWLSRRGLRAAGSPLPLPPTRAASTGCSPGMDKGEPE